MERKRLEGKCYQHSGTSWPLLGSCSYSFCIYPCISYEYEYESNYSFFFLLAWTKTHPLTFVTWLEFWWILCKKEAISEGNPSIISSLSTKSGRRKGFSRGESTSCLSEKVNNWTGSKGGGGKEGLKLTVFNSRQYSVNWQCGLESFCLSVASIDTSYHPPNKSENFCSECADKLFQCVRTTGTVLWQQARREHSAHFPPWILCFLRCRKMGLYFEWNRMDRWVRFNHFCKSNLPFPVPLSSSPPTSVAPTKRPVWSVATSFDIWYSPKPSYSVTFLCKFANASPQWTLWQHRDLWHTRKWTFWITSKTRTADTGPLFSGVWTWCTSVRETERSTATTWWTRSSTRSGNSVTDWRHCSSTTGCPCRWSTHRSSSWQYASTSWSVSSDVSLLSLGRILLE